MKKIKSLLLSLAMLVSVLPLYGFRTAERAAPAYKAAASDLVVSAANKALASGMLKSLSEEMPEGSIPDGTPDETLNENQDEGPQLDLDATLEENLNAYQEENFEPVLEANPAPVDPQDVIESLEEAITYEEAAADESSVTDVKVLENRAEYYENEAIGYVQSAVDTKNAADQELDQYRQNAYSAAETAFGDVIDAYEQDAIALKAQEEAANQEAAAESTKCKPVAQKAAYEADKAADQAETAVAKAFLDKEEAERKAAEAKENYEKAQKAYEDAKAAIDADLANGLISAEEAVKRTELAEQEAKLVYDVVLATEAAATATREEAERQLSQAEGALNEAVEKLNDAIEENGKEVLKDTGIAAATGAALAVVKIVADSAERTVDNLEGDIEELESQVKKLNDDISAAQRLIDQAQDEIDKLNADDADYPIAKKALEDAEEAMTAAENIKNAAQDIIDAHTAAEANETLMNAIAAVEEGTADNDQILTVTNYLLKNAELYIGGEEAKNLSEDATIEYLDNTNNIIKITDNDVTTYYQCESVQGTDGNYYLQYNKVDYIPLSDDEEFKQQYFPEGSTSLEEDTDYIAQASFKVSTRSFNIGNAPVYAIKDEETGEISYALSITGLYVAGTGIPDGLYTLTKNGDTWESTLTVKLFSVITYTPTVELSIDDLKVTEEDPSAKSSIIEMSWDGAKDAQQTYDDAEAALATAQSEYETAKELYDTLIAPWNTQLSENEAEKAALIEQKTPIEASLKSKKKDLNGDAIEQVVVGFITGEGSRPLVEEYDKERLESYDSLKKEYETASALEKIGIAIAIGLIETEAMAKAGMTLEDFEEASEIGSDIAEIISGVNNMESITDIVNNPEMLESLMNLFTTTSLSARTKEIIASKIEDIVAEWHHTAVENLKEAVDKGLKEVGELTAEAAEAGLNAAEKKLVLEVAEAAEKLAQSLADEAEDEYLAAQEANKKAKEARDNIQALIDSGYGPDSSQVKNAELYYNIARDSAKYADEAYNEANEAAKAARISANNARKAANKLRDPFIPSYMPIPRPHHYPSAPCYTTVTPVNHPYSYPYAPYYAPVSYPYSRAYTPATYPYAYAGSAFRPATNSYTYPYIPSYMPVTYPMAQRGNTNQAFRRTFFFNPRA